MSQQYTFLPWIRQGLIAALPNADSLTGNLPAHPTLPVTLRVNVNDVEVQTQLYGPGDVTGIDERVILRTEPAHLSTDFEANYLPAIEFSRPDFPWLFTPAKAESQGRLRPWLCLICVRKGDGVTLTTSRENPMLTLQIAANLAAAELPDLSESWAWAHVQIAGELTGSHPNDLATIVAERRIIARLLCPRRLAPNQNYYACLVPAFKAAGVEVEPMWAIDELGDDDEPIVLPVYYSWEFGTSPLGDFEELVRRLEPRQLPAEVGIRPMDVSNPGGGVPAPGAFVGLEGALRSPQTRSSPWPEPARTDFQVALTHLLDATTPIASEPIVTAPLYGKWHAAQATVPPEGGAAPWLRDLNLDPRLRAAAGLGTRIVQEQQEALMASAWDQAGEINRVNEVLRRAQLARVASTVYYQKHLSRLPLSAFLLTTQPVHARVHDGVSTVHGHVSRSTFPTAALSAAFRRMTRPRGPLIRRFLSGLTTQTRPFVAGINGGWLSAASPPAAPDGMVSAWTTLFEEFGLCQPNNNLTPKLREMIRVLREQLGEGHFDPADGRLQHLQYLEAALEKFDHLCALEAQDGEGQVPAPQLPLDGLRDLILYRLHPDVSVPAKVWSRISIRPGLWSNEDPIEPILVAPEFPQPMYEPLRDLSQDLLLPGIDKVPQNTIALLETNSRFVEAYMVGLNHEMSRELLWREFPTDQRGTCFRQFWDVRSHIPPPRTEAEREALKDIPPIHTWRVTPLGQNMIQHGSSSAFDSGANSEEQLVLLIRGDLLRRYPETLIYAVRGDWVSGQRKPNLSHDAQLRFPLFRGTLKPDITFVGFDLVESEVYGNPVDSGDAGWFFVVQEQPTAMRFGLDSATVGGLPVDELDSWDDLTWGHLVEAPDFESLSHIPVHTARLTGRTYSSANWGNNAAHFAKILRQKPLRIAIHADDMLPERSVTGG